MTILYLRTLYKGGAAVNNKHDKLVARLIISLLFLALISIVMMGLS